MGQCKKEPSIFQNEIQDNIMGNDWNKVKLIRKSEPTKVARLHVLKRKTYVERLGKQ